MNNPDYSRLVSQRHLTWLNLIVRGIENAMESLPDDVRQYMELRYLGKNYYNNAGLALKLNVSERTAAYWDCLVLETVAKHIGIFNFNYKIAETLQF